MATTEGSTDSEGQRELTKRDRAFLGQLPDDFLRVEEVPRSEQRTQSGQRLERPALFSNLCTGLCNTVSK